MSSAEDEIKELKEKLQKMTIKALDTQRVLVETRDTLRAVQKERDALQLEVSKLNAWKVWE